MIASVKSGCHNGGPSPLEPSDGDARALREGRHKNVVDYPSSPSATRSRSTPASAKLARKRRTRSNSRSFNS